MLEVLKKIMLSHNIYKTIPDYRSFSSPVSPQLRRPLHILMVATRYFPYMGGAETHVYEAGQRLVEAGLNVTVLTTDLSGKLPLYEEMKGMAVHRVRAWPTRKDYYFAPEMYHFIRHGQWDLVHCQGYHNLVAPTAMLAARQAKIPYVLTFHSGGHASHLRNALRGQQLRMLRPLMQHAYKLIAVSQFEADFFHHHLRLPASQFTIIPNGAHLPEPLYENAVTADTDTGTLIVSVGRLERYKGHQHLITALPKIRAWRPDARLLILGAGPYEAELRTLARRIGVDAYVEIRAIPPGERQTMSQLLSRAALVALLSEYEAHPLAVMEALALHRPVLTTNSSGFKELAERRLVRTIPLGSSPEQITQAVRQQIEAPILPHDPLALPSWDDCAARLLDLYQQIYLESRGGTLCVS